MDQSKLVAVLAAGAAMLVAACGEVIAPRLHSLLAPPAPRLTVNGPPDTTIIVGSSPLTKKALPTFPWETWVTIEVSDSIAFTSLPPAPGASPYYQTPGQKVGATGVTDMRISDPAHCALRLFVYGPQINTSSFGACGAPQKIDTTKLVGPDTVKRAAGPFQNPYDCDPWGNLTCHEIPNGSQVVRVRPVPVAIKQLKTNKSLVDTANPVSTQFTAGFTPDSISVGGNKTPHPFRITLWQWLAADSALGPVTLTCVASNLLCTYTPAQAGRMSIKMFVGGWEQNSSVTVQCRMPAADSALNDPTDDFKVRQAILDMRRRSNTDSAVDAGFNATHPGWNGGWIHEVQVAVWQLPNGGGFQADTVLLTQSDACHANGALYPPEPGATLVAFAHMHPTPAGKPSYCYREYTSRGVTLRIRQSPSDTTRPVWFAPPDSTGPNRVDRKTANNLNVPGYVLTHSGVLLRITPVPQDYNLTLPVLYNFYRARGGTATQRKCNWPKNQS